MRVEPAGPISFSILRGSRIHIEQFSDRHQSIMFEDSDVALHRTTNLDPPLPFPEGGIVFGQALVEPQRNIREIVRHKGMGRLVKNDSQRISDRGVPVDDNPISECRRGKVSN